MEKQFISTKDTFVHNLKVIMKERKINRIKLSKELNIPYTTLCDWCTGRIFPKFNKIDMIAKYFELNASDLIGLKLLSDSDDDLTNEIAEVFIAERIPFEMTPREATRKHGWFISRIPPELLTNGRYYFGLKISDESMTPKFHIDDWVIFYQTDVIDRESYYCVKFPNQDAVIRQIIIVNGGYLVLPLNMSYGLKPEVFKKEDLNSKIFILGRAVRMSLKEVENE